LICFGAVFTKGPRHRPRGLPPVRAILVKLPSDRRSRPGTDGQTHYARGRRSRQRSSNVVIRKLAKGVHTKRVAMSPPDRDEMMVHDIDPLGVPRWRGLRDRHLAAVGFHTPEVAEGGLAHGYDPRVFTSTAGEERSHDGHGSKAGSSASPRLS
jgi:hypothetical protein